MHLLRHYSPSYPRTRSARRLHGDLIFLKSSCESCATVTGRNEQVFLRSVLGEARAHLQIGNPKNRPKSLSITPADRSEPIAIPVSLHPFTFMLMVTDPPTPAILRKVSEVDWVPFGTNCRFWRYDGPDNQRRIEEFGPGAKTTLRHAPNHFTLMLGKIAHAYACAKLGYEAFERFLPALIRTDSDRIGYYIWNS